MARLITVSSIVIMCLAVTIACFRFRNKRKRTFKAKRGIAKREAFKQMRATKDMRNTGNDEGRHKPKAENWAVGKKTKVRAFGDEILLGQRSTAPQIEEVCAVVYKALLVDEISGTQAKVGSDLLGSLNLRNFLDAVNANENPLFVGSKPLHENILWQTSPTNPVLVEIKFEGTPRNVMVVGDLHGRLGSLRRAHAKWVREDKKPYVVGLGDMVDRGNRQVEVLAAFLAWRCMFPYKVIVLRGNHETEKVNTAFGLRCADKIPPYANQGLFAKLNKIFEKIPTAVIIKQPPGFQDGSGVFMHGGFGPQAFIASEEPAKEPDNLQSIAHEMKWFEVGDHECSIERTDTWFAQGRRGDGFKNLFCRLLSYHFLKNFGACNLFTAHTHINVQASDVTAATIDPDMNSDQHIASLANCKKMRHYVTVSAHRIHDMCTSKREELPPMCVGMVTMVRFDNNEFKISQEDLFDSEVVTMGCGTIISSILGGGKPKSETTMTEAEKLLDIGRSLQYPKWSECAVLKSYPFP